VLGRKVQLQYTTENPKQQYSDSSNASGITQSLRGSSGGKFPAASLVYPRPSASRATGKGGATFDFEEKMKLLFRVGIQRQFGLNCRA